MPDATARATASASAHQFTTPRFLPGAFILLWSTGYVAGKLSLNHAGPFTVCCLRFACVALLLGGAAVVSGARWPRGREAMHLAITGLLAQAVQFNALYFGLRQGVSAGVSALIIGLMPIATAALAAPLLGERTTARQWIGLGAGLAGVGLVVANKLGNGSAAPAAYGLIVLALAGLTLGTLYQKRFCARMDLRSGACIQYVAATLASLPFAAGLEGFAADWSAGMAGTMGWLIFVNSALGATMLSMLIRAGSAAKVASLFYLVPGVAAVMGFAAFGERLSATALAGFALTMGAVWVCTRAPRS
ncbi:DMT family transporter [Derxia gummosa]|uniref:DMT family transporter n=1 Tax=Derxia gummosa DSM 723 TaxID=1121388 RepID=A0A8B6X599_9BURK|nr:DMT family transporter [Derxia gummosa]